MKKYLLLAALLLCAAPAFATNCNNGATNYPKCDNNKPPTSQPPSNHNGQGQGQQQGQAQGQNQGQAQTAHGGTGTGIGVGIGQGGAGGHGGAGGQGGAGGSAAATGGAANATSGSTSGAISGSQSGVSGSGNATLGDVGSSSAARSNSGGNTLSNGSASSSGSTSNGVVSVDAADRSSTNIRNQSNVFIPGDLPTNAMTIAPGAYITVAGDTECGVLQTKVEVPVYQWNKRGTKKVQVGTDEDLAPVFDSNGVQIDYQTVYTGNGGYYLRGSHVTYVLSTQGSSNSSQLGLQGGGGGGYGGVSYGSGRSYSQAGARLMIRSCIAARFEPKPVAQPVVRRPVAKKKRPVVRRAPTCVERAATTCPAK